MSIEVLIVDAHPVVREGLKLLLAGADGLSVTGDVATLASAIDAVTACPPDVLLLDLDLADGDGLALLPKLPQVAPRTKALVLTGIRDRARHEAAVLAGARGLLVKDRPPEVLLKAIRKVHEGELWFDRQLLDSTLQRALGAAHPPVSPAVKKFESLTERERQIVSLLSQGLRNAEIGTRLGISEKTVRNHLISVYDKLGVADRLELLAFCYDHGFVQRS